MIDLTAVPFNLDENGCRWVEETLANMTEHEKVGQLFCEILWDTPGADPEDLFRVISPGAVMYRPFSGKRMNEVSNILQSRSKIPLLIASNLERGGSGGNGGITDGTYLASPMGVAATDDRLHAYRVGTVAGREGSASGINWTFEPIVDIDRNSNNPITNVRTYGSDVDRIITMAQAYMEGCAENGMAVAIKHFPGDGVDFRDQHLMASINDLSADEWFATFGKVYQALIDRGAQALMSAHIKQPALTKLVNPDISDADILPSSLSAELNQGIIRDRLGFNGVIVTDATQMVGFTASLPRAKAVPTAIANGCDMFLFTINQAEDVQHMLAGVADGTISAQRLDDAVTRILAMKASLNLHVKQQAGQLVPPVEGLQVLQCEEHVQWARDCADKSVTLVKDNEELLPISPDKHKKIALIVVTNENTTNGYPAEIQQFKRLLEGEGFGVEYFASMPHPGVNMSLAEFTSTVDLIVYYANMKVGSNQTTIRITWNDFLGDDSPKFVKDIPTLFVSFSNPYHLVDVPMVQTYVNAYSSNSHTVAAVVEKLLGRSEFVGTNPVDPFAGLADTYL